MQASTTRAEPVHPVQPALRRAAVLLRSPTARYVAGVLAPRRRLLRRGEARPDAAVHGLGVRDLASRRARASPRSTCGACAGGPGILIGEFVVNGELLLDDARAAARKPARPADRQHGRDHRRGHPAAPADRPPRGPGSSRAGRRDARRARHRHRDQRDRGDGVDAGRRGHRGVRGAQVLADVVARRHLGRTRRPAADAGVGSRSRWRHGGASARGRARS